VVSRNSFKFVMLPPQTDTTRGWARCLAEAVPEARVVVADDADTAAREIVDAEAAFGWLGKELLSKATKLRWLQAPHGPYLDERRFEIMADNRRAFAAGHPLRNQVDKASWF
jgi:hypothetical protein